MVFFFFTYQAAFEVSSRLRGSFVVNIAKHLSGGVHLYDVISGTCVWGHGNRICGEHGEAPVWGCSPV